MVLRKVPLNPEAGARWHMSPAPRVGWAPSLGPPSLRVVPEAPIAPTVTNQGGPDSHGSDESGSIHHARRVSDAIKASFYLRPDQMNLLDDYRAQYRSAGERWVSASDVVRAALDLADEHLEEWHTALMKGR